MTPNMKDARGWDLTNHSLVWSVQKYQCIWCCRFGKRLVRFNSKFTHRRHIDETDTNLYHISWASATRLLRKLKQRIMAVRGRREVHQHEMWRFDDASQWEALWSGEDAFWKNAANIRAAGLSSILTLQQVSTLDSALRVSRVTREKGSKGHQHFRIVISERDPGAI